MTVDEVTNTLNRIGDIKEAFVIATDGEGLAVVVCGKVREVSTLLAVAAINDEDIRHVIGYAAAALTIGK